MRTILAVLACALAHGQGVAPVLTTSDVGSGATTNEGAGGGEGAAGVAASVDRGGGGGVSDELAFDGTSGSVASRQRPGPAMETDDHPRASEPGSAPCHELTQAGIKPGPALSPSSQQADAGAAAGGAPAYWATCFTFPGLSTMIRSVMS